MSKVRLLVGTRKGAFVLMSDGKRERWDISGPHFGGGEIYHLKGSAADPQRLYASQSTGCSIPAGCTSGPPEGRCTPRPTPGITGSLLSGIYQPCCPSKPRRCHDPSRAPATSADAGRR